MLQFSPADTFFGMAISIAPAAFHLYEMQDAIPACDNIHFITTVAKIALKDSKSFFDEPLCCQSLPTGPYFLL